MKLLGIEMSFEEFDRLLCEQSQGKELVIENGKVIAIDRTITEKELLNNELLELTNWFENYFRKQLEQSLWQDDFTVAHDEYFDKDYADFNELKVQAKVVRDRIREIKEKLKTEV